MPDEPAVLFFQWRPRDERDEIAKAIEILKAEHARGEAGRARGELPHIASHTCTSENPVEFGAELACELAKLPSLQVLYLSAHGLDDALARDRDGHVRLAFDELRPFLERGLEKARDVTAVFGLCYALSPRSFLLSALPDAIVEAYGFTETPLVDDVAGLIAGILADDATLMADASRQNAALFGQGVPQAQAGPVFEELERRLDAAVDHYESTHEPEFLVPGSKGASVRRVRRSEDGSWETVASVAVPGRGAEERAGAVRGGIDANGER
jgi:hypothetical protein